MSKFILMCEKKLLMITLIACFLSLFVASSAFAGECEGTPEGTMCWKDYNGEDPGGYMPDIDQNQDFDKVEVRTEESDPSISYQGTWTTINDPGASGGSRNYADHPASFTFSFTGSSIKWIDTKAYNRGISEVWIDGNLMTTVDLYDPNVVNQVVLYSNSSLSSGPHTIQIKSTNTKNPSSSGYLTSNDALDVDDIEHEYCAPVAEANSLWWLDKKYRFGIFEDPENGTGYIGGDVNGDNPQHIGDILDFVQELATFKKTNVGHTGTTVLDEQAGIEAFLEKYNLGDKLYEHTAWDSDYVTCMDFFHFLEEEVERSQDVKLDLGFWHVEKAIEMEPGVWQVWWSRRGGHAVTVAGVDSQNNLFAISDPDNDAAEGGAPGVVRPLPGGHPAHAGDPTVHNNEMFASHDIYTVGPSPSPGGKCGLLNYPFKWNFPPHEWKIVGPVVVEWPEPLEYSMTFTELEAAVIVSPIICGNGVVDPGETCDPPGSQWPPNGNPCRQTCTYCGDGIVNNGEQCDDGNANNNDGCTNNCMLPVCGDGIIGPGETCDPPGLPGPNPLQPGNCRQTCTYCGDGIKNNNEQCDDGNGNNNDGCTNNCQIGKPDISVSPTNLNFAQVIVGGSSTKTLTISNTGDANLSIYTIGISGTNANQFSKQNDNCSGQNIAPSGSCTVDVKFSPTSTGKKTATLSINSNDPDENPVKVPLQGKGAKVVVTSPNGGEILHSQKTWNITWQTSSIVGSVAKSILKYTTNGGSTWTTIAIRYDNYGTYPWVVPVVSSTKCKVKVILKNASGVTVGSDVSDSTFTISP